MDNVEIIVTIEIRQTTDYSLKTIAKTSENMGGLESAVQAQAAMSDMVERAKDRIREKLHA